MFNFLRNLRIIFSIVTAQTYTPTNSAPFLHILLIIFISFFYNSHSINNRCEVIWVCCCHFIHISCVVSDVELLFSKHFYATRCPGEISSYIVLKWKNMLFQMVKETCNWKLDLLWGEIILYLKRNIFSLQKKWDLFILQMWESFWPFYHFLLEEVLYSMK